MNDDKIKESNRFEDNSTKDTGAGKPGDPGNDFKTREMSVEELQAKLREEQGQAPPEPPLDADMPGEMPEDNEPIKVTPEEYEGMPEESLPDMMPPPPKAATSPTTRILFLVILGLLVVMVYFMLQPREEIPVPQETAPQETAEAAVPDTGEGDETEPGMLTETVQPPSSSPLPERDSVKAIPVYNLSAESIRGTAPIVVKEGGPVVSEEADPEIAAIGDALRLRVKALYGSKTKTVKELVTVVTSGKFNRFQVVHTLQKKEGEVIRSETVVITPARARLVTRDNILVSMTRTDYDKLYMELKKAGLEVIKKRIEEEGVMTVHLKVAKLSPKALKAAFVIGPESVGSVKLGMPVDKLETSLPRGFSLVEKNILFGDEYYDTFKVYDKSENSLFFVTQKNDEVQGIQVVSKRFKTDKGIGIGDTLDELRISYAGDRELKISTTKSGLPYVVVKGLRVKFVLQSKGIDFEAKKFPGGAKIDHIVLGNSPFVK